MIPLILALFGLILGSFIGAQVWRMRARQLAEDKANGEEYDKNELIALSKLLGKKQADDRSICLKCKHQLAWYDLLPIVSWLTTRGRCRYCRERIGWYEPLVEIGVAGLFVISYIFWPIELTSVLSIGQFVFWLLAGLFLVFLFVYDAKWFLLPDKIVWPTVAIAAGYFGLGVFESGVPATAWLPSILGSLAILSGLYYVIWIVSRGAWIGFGDVKLGLALALLAGTWELAFLTLFLANLIGCLIVIPGLLSKKMTRTTQVPFGPMLIVATVISVLFGGRLIEGYISIIQTMLML